MKLNFQRHKRKKKNNNIIRYHNRVFRLNIGVILFALVFIYFLVNLVSFTFRDTVSGYEVEEGQISETTVYTGLALRSESVVKADDSGSLNYYMKEGDRAGYNDKICSIDQNGEISQKITEAGKDISKLSNSDLESIRNMISEYSQTYSDDNFYNVYSFEENLNSTVQEDLYLEALKDYSDETDQAVNDKTFTFERANQSGILALYTDGYENITLDNFQADDYDPGHYKRTDLNEKTTVKQDSAIYKLVTSEYWYVLFPLTNDEAKKYEDLDVVNVTFTEDDVSCYASCTVKKYNGKPFMQLRFNSGMVRYVSDRYIDIALNLNESSGLKIPNSAITSKEFYVIPKDYLTKGGDTSEDGVLKLTDSEGSPEFTKVDVYGESSKYYYISEDSIEAGDQIQLPNSTRTYTIEKTASLKGVYNINKGYAVFKVIDILGSNQEYTIVASGTDYGISVYDHIALNADEVKEGEIIT